MHLPAAPPLPDLFLVEGDEEVQYVYMELPASTNIGLPGTSLSLTGLDSDNPTLLLEDGTVLQGEYEEPLGSIMFFERGATASDTGGAAEGGADGTGGTTGEATAEPGSSSGQPASVHYRGHCESKLVFQVVQQGRQQKQQEKDNQLPVGEKGQEQASPEQQQDQQLNGAADAPPTALPDENAAG